MHLFDNEPANLALLQNIINKIAQTIKTKLNIQHDVYAAKSLLFFTKLTPNQQASPNYIVDKVIYKKNLISF